MKKYEILEKKDFHRLMDKIGGHIIECEQKKIKFPKMNVTVKSWRKDKTPQQHKYFFVCANELRKAFHKTGVVYTVNQMKDFIKLASGFSEEIKLPGGRVITMARSISDDSNDVDIKKMADMIDFTIQFAQQNLDYYIEDPRS